MPPTPKEERYWHEIWKIWNSIYVNKKYEKEYSIDFEYYYNRS